MTICHCLCGGGITRTNDSPPCLMTWLLPHHLGATGALWDCGQKDVDELNTFPAGVPAEVGRSTTPTLPPALRVSCVGWAFWPGDGIPGWEPGVRALPSISGGAAWLLPGTRSAQGGRVGGAGVWGSPAHRVQDKPHFVKSYH